MTGERNITIFDFTLTPIRYGYLTNDDTIEVYGEYAIRLTPSPFLLQYSCHRDCYGAKNDVTAIIIIVFSIRHVDCVVNFKICLSQI